MPLEKSTYHFNESSKNKNFTVVFFRKKLQWKLYFAFNFPL